MASTTRETHHIQSSPWRQALLDLIIGASTSLTTTVKLLAFVVFCFQDSLICLRPIALCSTSMGIIIISSIMLVFSSYPFIVVTPDIIMTPHLFKFNSRLQEILQDDEDELKATAVILILGIILVSSLLHILLAHKKKLRLGQYLPYAVSCGMFAAIGLLLLYRSIMYSWGTQIIPSLFLGVCLSQALMASWTWQYVLLVALSILLFHITITFMGCNLNDMREMGWMVENISIQTVDSIRGVSMAPWLMWMSSETVAINFNKVRFDVFVSWEFIQSLLVLLFLLLLYHSMLFSLINRTFNPNAKINNEIWIYGIASMISATLGAIGGMISVQDMTRLKILGGGEILPSIVNCVFLYIFVLSGLLGHDFLPRFVMSGILAGEGLVILQHHLTKSYQIGGAVEFICVVVIAIASFFDFFNGFLVGSALALLRYSIRFSRLGCIKLTGTGLTIRSTADRDDNAIDWLSSHGEKIRVIQLRGTVAFINASGVLDVVLDVLEEDTYRIHKNHDTPQLRFKRWIQSLLSSFVDDKSNVHKYIRDDEEDSQNNMIQMNDNELPSLQSKMQSSLSISGKKEKPDVETKRTHNHLTGKKNASVPLQDMFIPPSISGMNVDGSELSIVDQCDGSIDDTNRGSSRGTEVGSANSSYNNRMELANKGQSQTDNQIKTNNIDSWKCEHLNSLLDVKTIASEDRTKILSLSNTLSENFHAPPTNELNELFIPSMTNSSTPTSSISSRNNFNETLNEFFRPEFLIIDMALTVGIDTAALETFELILNYCRKHDVTLVLSGSERHLDYLVQQGIFLPNNHHPNLDAALESCEDTLLDKYQVSMDESTSLNTCKLKSLSSAENGTNCDQFKENEKTNIPQSALEVTELNGVYQYKPSLSSSCSKFDYKKGFLVALRRIGERHDIEPSVMDRLKKLIDFVKPTELTKGEVIMDTTQGSVIDLEQDGLWFIEEGKILIERDINQSTMQTTQTRRRIRQSVPPRIQRLKHRNFQLGRIGPGGLIGTTELCSGYRSLGRFVIDSDVCKLHFLSFGAIKDLEVSHPDVALNVVKLSSMLLADRFDRTREQLSQLFDTVYGPAQKVSTATEKAMKKIRSSLSLQNNAIHISQKKIR